MKWDYWICLYTQTHCVARGLRPLTIAAYRKTLQQFRAYVEIRLDDISPDQVTAYHVLQYLEHLRTERSNGDSAVNRQATVLKNFYRAIVAMGHLHPSDNPLAHFPRIKARPRKLPVTLSEEEVQRLIAAPPKNTILGLRDRAILTLLYGTGIRASECASLREEDVNLDELTIKVVGKAGHERVLPMNVKVAEAMHVYREYRGELKPTCFFFQSRTKRGMSRGAIYDRVRTWSAKARIPKRVSPHRLRHTFATHLLRTKTSLVDIRELLGHRQISSTQLYVHVTVEDLREAIRHHPIQKLAEPLAHLLPKVRMPFQPPPGRRLTG